MSIVKRYSVARNYSYRMLQDEGTPGRYRKLSEEESTAEWKRFKEQPILQQQPKQRRARPLSFAFGSRESEIVRGQIEQEKFGSQDFHKHTELRPHSVATLPGRLKNIIDAKKKVRRKTTGSFNSPQQPLATEVELSPQENIHINQETQSQEAKSNNIESRKKKDKHAKVFKTKEVKDELKADVRIENSFSADNRKGSNVSENDDLPPLPASLPPLTLVSEPDIIREYQTTDLEMSLDKESAKSNSSDASSRKALHNGFDNQINFDENVPVYHLEPKMAQGAEISPFELDNGHIFPKTEIAYYGPVYLRQNKQLLSNKENGEITKEDLALCDSISSCSSKSTSSSKNGSYTRSPKVKVMEDTISNDYQGGPEHENIELQENFIRVSAEPTLNASKEYIFNKLNNARDVSPEHKFDDMIVVERKFSDGENDHGDQNESYDEEPRHLEIDVSISDVRHGDSDSGINGTRDSASVSPMSSPSHSINISPVSNEIHQVLETLDNAITSSAVQEDTSLMTNKKHQGHFVVVAIDFGTTYSGYAFSFTRDPNSIHMMRKWEGGDPGVINQKTITTILLTPSGDFHSFGFSARDNFHDLDQDEAKNWLYFENFKMLLHNAPELSRDTLLMASNGKLFPALTVFAFALQFFKDHALQELSDQSGMRIINEDIRWVITVPAIWKAPAKQFMRQAAYEAGLISPEFPEQLIIALEPEVASIYCRKLKMHQLIPETIEQRPLQSPHRGSSDPMNLDPACKEFGTGTRYMVVDCGGGTVDITVHEIDPNGKLVEINKATGGPHGAVGVDMEFEELLKSIFGKDFIESYKTKRPAGWVDLMVTFESRKRSASPNRTTSLNISLPFSFIDYFKKHKGGNIENLIKKHGDKGIRWTPQGMLRLSPNAMKHLFHPTVEKIKQAVGDIVNHPDIAGLKYMFLVGGFAESEILQHEMRKDFSNLLKIIIPQGVGMSILKGAVLFGLDPTIVSVRRSRLTYGVGVLNRYNSQRHPKDKMVSKDGCTWCTDVFDKYVTIDQPIALGDVVLRSYTPARLNQKISQINIYCSDDKEANFITDPGVRKCGALSLDLESDLESDYLPQRREIQTRMQFGETEIRVSALDVTTGRQVQASIDFLDG